MKLDVVHVSHRDSDEIGAKRCQRRLERISAEATIPDQAHVTGGLQRPAEVGEADRVDGIRLIVTVEVDEQHAHMGG